MAGPYREDTCAKSMDQGKQYLTASIRTTDNLRTIAHSAMVRDLSRLSLPEIDAAVALVGKVVPAGNVLRVILNGLTRLSGRKKNILNDIIDEREVFPNVDAVAPTSSLTRFITAQDDNEMKTLAWGVMTYHRRNGISLHDFCLQAGLLESAGHRNIAVRMTRDYLDGCAHGLNRCVCEL
jgi:hypothetical protein